MSNEFGKYLSDFLNKNNYKIENFAKEVGYSTGLISHYTTGKRSPSYKFIESFFEKFNFSAEEKEKVLKILDEDKMPSSLKKIKISKNELVETEFMTIPVYNSVSAGLGCEVCSDPIDYLPYPKTTGEIIAIRVEGDSMEDTIPDGSTIVVKKNVMVEIGEIGVFLTNGIDYKEGYVKRLRHKNGTYVLESDNKKYEDIKIKTSDIIACGKVIKIMTDTNKKIKDPLYNYIDMLSEEQRKIIEPMLKGLVEKK